ncbi:F-box/FBD/LRR-repeat protein At1g16930-like isoform X1 [Fagus crenata]
MAKQTEPSCYKGKGVYKDRISELPDEILVCILSYLSVREAMATSVLSRRWRSYITRLRLHFDDTKALDKDHQLTERQRFLERVNHFWGETERQRFVERVNHFLGENDEVPTIDEFRISFDLNQSFTQAINSWIEFAMTRQVQRLEMDLLGFRPYHGLSSRHLSKKKKKDGWSSRLWNEKCRQLLSSQQSCGWSRTQFCLSLPSIRPPTFLKELYLKNVSITQEVVEYFLANCPNLERLSVCGSRHLVKLRVSGSSSPSLKHLEVVSCISLQTIRICDTNLISFKYVGYNTYVYLGNAPLLVDVYIGDYFAQDIVSRLSCCPSLQLQILTLELCYEFGHMVAWDFPRLKNLKKLVFGVGAWDYDNLLGLTSITKEFPYLQILVLKVATRLLDNRE